MTNSILIGEYIYGKLSGSDELKAYVGNKIYPLVAENTTTFPFVLYMRDDITPMQMTKDGYCQDDVSFSINVVDTDYTKTIHIANIVRKLMEKLKLRNDDICIYNTAMTSITENFVENAYVQTLSFRCKVEN